MIPLLLGPAAVERTDVIFTTKRTKATKKAVN